MWLFRVLNGFDPISFASDAVFICRSRISQASRENRQLKKFPGYFQGLCGLAFFGLMFSASVFAQANGTHPFDVIKNAKTIINYAGAHSICSSKYIANKTYLAECVADIRGLTTWVDAWETKLKSNTLTVAYNVSVQDEIYDYSNALKTVLEAAGYKNPLAKGEDPSPAYQIFPDEIAPDGMTPDGAGLCATCASVAIGNAVRCGAALEVTPAFLLCEAITLGGFILCDNSACVPLTTPPKACK